MNFAQRCWVEGRGCRWPSKSDLVDREREGRCPWKRRGDWKRARDRRVG